MTELITPPPPELFTKDQEEKIIKGVVKGAKIVKWWFIITLFGGVSVASLVLWAIIHFLRKWW